DLISLTAGDNSRLDSVVSISPKLFEEGFRKEEARDHEALRLLLLRLVSLASSVSAVGISAALTSTGTKLSTMSSSILTASTLGTALCNGCFPSMPDPSDASSRGFQSRISATHSPHACLRSGPLVSIQVNQNLIIDHERLTS